MSRDENENFPTPATWESVKKLITCSLDRMNFEFMYYQKVVFLQGEPWPVALQCYCHWSFYVRRSVINIVTSQVSLRIFNLRSGVAWIWNLLLIGLLCNMPTCMYRAVELRNQSRLKKITPLKRNDKKTTKPVALLLLLKEIEKIWFVWFFVLLVEVMFFLFLILFFFLFHLLLNLGICQRLLLCLDIQQLLYQRCVVCTSYRPHFSYLYAPVNSLNK